MNTATLQMFRDMADAMQTEPTDWEWVGPHMSQRMFGITESRAKAFAERHGGRARKMGSPRCNGGCTLWECGRENGHRGGCSP